MPENVTRKGPGRRQADLERQLTLEAANRGAEEILRAYEATLEGWIRALDLRDGETEGHSRRVVDLTLRLAGELGVCGEQLVHIRRGALLHDVGKMALPDSILLKAGELDEGEQALMRRHPEHAWQMLRGIEFLRPALEIPFCHHERWDGSGYPRGLKGEAIPLAARLFAVVDVWDALRYDRAYRAGWPAGKVKDHLREGAGSHFDPKVVPVFLSILERDGEPVFPDWPAGR